MPLTLHAVWRELDPTASVGDLALALGGCDGTTDEPYRVALASDMTAQDDELSIGCAAVLDLQGHDLEVSSVDVTYESSLAIEDSTATPTDLGGTLTATAATGYTPGIAVHGDLVITSGRVVATGGEGAAGIGGRYRDRFGNIRIDGGEVVAQGGEGFAGIGGGAEGRGQGSVEIHGGTVTATGGDRGPGIGEVGAVGITDGTVAAHGGVAAAGIGGRTGGRGAWVMVTGGDVTAVGGAATDDHPAGSAVGAGGSAYRVPDFGHLEVSGGTFRLPSGVLRVSDVATWDDELGEVHGPEVVVGPAGRIVGAASVEPGFVLPSDEGGPGEVSAGEIANGGVITLPTESLAASGVEVSDRHYELTLDAGEGALPDGVEESVTVFADTLEHGERTLPDPTRSGSTFQGWETEDGQAVTPTTDLTALLPPAPGTPSELTLHARWAPAGGGGTTPTTPTTPTEPSNVVVPAPTVTSTGDLAAPRVGDRLTAAVTGVPAAVTVTWQWWRSGPDGSAPIAGATAPAYEIGPGDAGSRLHVVATGRQAGYGDGSTPSVVSGPVARGLLDSPLVVTDDRDGHPVVGAPVTASVELPDLPGVSVSWQWQTRDGSAWADVTGATGATHVPTPAEAGRLLRVVATVTAPGYETATLDHEVGTVAPAAAPEAGVSLRGQARSGRTLVARLDQPLADGQAVAWTWERRTADGWRTVRRADRATYRPTRADVGHRLRVVATITTPGHEARVVRATSAVVKRARR